MRSYLECFSCFLDHGLDIARRRTLDEKTQRKVLDEIALELPKFSMEMTPPLMSLRINQIIIKYTSMEDPFAEEKKLSNRLALDQAPLVRRRLGESPDPLKAAVEYAIAGNSIDFGAYQNLDIAKAINLLVDGEEHRIAREEDHFFQLESFKKSLLEAERVLYITDNAGEIVFDMLLMEIMLQQHPGIEIIVAPRSAPILNDATAEDAMAIGLNRIGRILPSGSTAPGTPLELCTPEFLEVFYGADLVIAKGQGNYETLSESPRPLFLLFKVKCPVVARHCGARLGDILLIPSQKASSGTP
jgi:damage-control phosphatase, subfamily I